MTQPPVQHREGAPEGGPVFVCGISRRCGTNFLANCLGLHPDLHQLRLLPEDFLLEYAHTLPEYVDATAKRWAHPAGFDEQRERDALLRALGSGIESFLVSHVNPGRRPLSRTPSPRNLNLFPRLFPDGKLVVLIRDGRDVVDSAARSWPRVPMPYWMHKWARAAGQVQRCCDPETPPEGRHWVLVRFESLVADTQDSVGALLDFLGLDRERFPWDRLDSVGVRGSSTVRGQAGRLNWQKVERPDRFNPVGKWRDWGFLTRWTFKLIAGRQLIQLGYAKDLRW
jgi:hypothetical protein